MFTQLRWHAQKYLHLIMAEWTDVLRYRRNNLYTYLADFDLDLSQVGGFVACGRQHAVYRYKTNQVIKIPQSSLYMRVYGGLTYQHVLKELSLLKTFLPDFIPQTQILSTPKHDGYVVIQEFLPHAPCTRPAHLPHVAHDFERIIKGQQALRQNHGLSLDLLGNKGLQQSIIASLIRQKERALMHNVLLVKRSGCYTVRIVDFNLFHVKADNQDVPLFRRIIDYACFVLSRVLLKDNFGLSL